MNKAAKQILYMTLALAGLMVIAAPGLAANGPEWTHGNYTNNTNACAICHVTHSAPYAQLLNNGPTKTHFCYVCHGQGAPGAPYDIQLGRTMAYDSINNRTVWYPSTAGGFEGQLTPDPGVAYSVYGASYDPVTSRHNVSGYSGDTGAISFSSVQGDVFIPGSIKTLTENGLECTSCHDPHAGGPYPNYAVNARLLRSALLVDDTVYGDLYMEIRYEWLGTSAVNQFAYRVTAYDNIDTYSFRRDLYNSSRRYDTGSNNWCGACHGKFDVRTPSGRMPDLWRKYRHAMGIPAPASFIWGEGTPDKGMPMEVVRISDSGATIRKIACLTCHRAHSTTAAMDGVVDWPRSEGGAGTTSALLRMKKRDVCYNCHGAATRNSTNASVFNHDSAWRTNDCWTCHNT